MCCNGFPANSGSRPREGTSEEGRGAGEDQPSRPDQTDISISGEELVPSIVRITFDTMLVLSYVWMDIDMRDLLVDEHDHGSF